MSNDDEDTQPMSLTPTMRACCCVCPRLSTDGTWCVECNGLIKIPPVDICPPAHEQKLQAFPAQEDWVLQFFDFAHLPHELGEISRRFCELAQHIVQTLPRNPERTLALRKLLEAKDCAVRARVAKGTP